MKTSTLLTRLPASLACLTLSTLLSGGAALTTARAEEREPRERHEGDAAKKQADELKKQEEDAKKKNDADLKKKEEDMKRNESATEKKDDADLKKHEDGLKKKEEDMKRNELATEKKDDADLKKHEDGLKMKEQGVQKQEQDLKHKESGLGHYDLKPVTKNSTEWKSRRESVQHRFDVLSEKFSSKTVTVEKTEEFRIHRERIGKTRDYFFGLIDLGVPPVLIDSWADAVVENEIITGMPTDLVMNYWGTPIGTEAVLVAGVPQEVWTYETSPGRKIHITVREKTVTRVRVS